MFLFRQNTASERNVSTPTVVDQPEQFKSIHIQLRALYKNKQTKKCCADWKWKLTEGVFRHLTKRQTLYSCVSSAIEHKLTCSVFTADNKKKTFLSAV